MPSQKYNDQFSSVVNDRNKMRNNVRLEQKLN